MNYNPFMTPTRNALIRRTWLNAVPAVLIVLGLVLLVRGMAQLADPRGAPPGKGPPPPAFAGIDAQKLNEQVDDLARKVNDLVLKRDALKDRLDAVSQQASHNLETLAEEVRTKYPLFSQMEDAREAAFRRLGDLASRLDWNQSLYGESDPQTRQEILSLESFAATQFVASSARAPQIITNLRLLGRFYADKYMSSGRTVEVDFERALYYYTLELEKSSGGICALNDLSWLHMEVARTPNLEKAQRLLEESLRVNPDQQRPLYNLGTLFLDPKDKTKLGKAREYLEKAAGIKNWETGPNEELASHVHYNLACTYSRLAEHESDGVKKKELLDLSALALGKAADSGGTLQAILGSDLEGGDLTALAGSADHAAQLGSMKERFSRARAGRAKA